MRGINPPTNPYTHMPWPPGVRGGRGAIDRSSREKQRKIRRVSHSLEAVSSYAQVGVMAAREVSPATTPAPRGTSVAKRKTVSSQASPSRTREGGEGVNLNTAARMSGAVLLGSAPSSAADDGAGTWQKLTSWMLGVWTTSDATPATARDSIGPADACRERRGVSGQRARTQ